MTVEPLPQPDLFGVVHVEAQHLKPGTRVRRPVGPAFTVTEVVTLGVAGGLFVRGKSVAHGGLVEIGCAPDTQFEVIT